MNRSHVFTGVSACVQTSKWFNGVCSWHICCVFSQEMVTPFCFQVRKIDNGYLVAWEQHLNYRITKASSSILGSMLSGEGVVCSFTGPGTVYVQTRSIKPLAACVAKEMKPK